MKIDLTATEINRLTVLLRDSAREKQRRAKEVHENDRQDMLNSALADFALRNKLVGGKTHAKEEA